MRVRASFYAAVIVVLFVLHITSSPVPGQGTRYGRELKEAGQEYGETLKKAFKPEDGKERAPVQKAGHAGKEFGKGTGGFFKNFGKSTGKFFKGLFVAE